MKTAITCIVALLAGSNAIKVELEMPGATATANAGVSTASSGAADG
jgi:hypothetical protein